MRGSAKGGDGVWMEIASLTLRINHWRHFVSVAQQHSFAYLVISSVIEMCSSYRTVLKNINQVFQLCASTDRFSVGITRMSLKHKTVSWKLLIICTRMCCTLGAAVELPLITDSCLYLYVGTCTSSNTNLLWCLDFLRNESIIVILIWNRYANINTHITVLSEGYE